MNKLNYVVAFLISICFICSCDDRSYTVGGTVSGLTGTLVLTDNGADDLSIVKDSNFTFKTLVNNKTEYMVAVKTQPSGQECTVTNGTGFISSANVTDVSVSCTSSSSPSAVFSYIQHDTVPETGDRVVINVNDTVTFNDTDFVSTPCKATVSFRIANIGEGVLRANATPVITIADGDFTQYEIPALPEFPIPAGSYKDFDIVWSAYGCYAVTPSTVTIKTNDPEHPDFSFTVMNAYS